MLTYCRKCQRLEIDCACDRPAFPGLVAVIVASVLWLAFASMALAHDHGHDLFHSYYQHWWNERGTHCCDETHCRPAEFRWNAETNTWQVLLRTGEWYTWEQSDMVVDDMGLGPFGSVCDTETGWVYCVDPPDVGG